jgi:dihydroxyacetone kinase-like protein
MNIKVYNVLEAISEEIKENKELLTKLDAAIGDADHGINLNRGFQAVATKLKDAPENDISSILKKVGMTLLSTVGGASGPLYGTAFMKAAVPAKEKEVINRELAAEMLLAAINGIKSRGKAVKGEKTMLDALEPAYEAIIAGIEEDKSLRECMELACKAAEEGVEFTKTIIATKGRASYLGERSIGHQDPGATSSTIILKVLTSFC